MSSRITGSITKSTASTNTTVTVSATGKFTYRSGTYGYTVNGYLKIGSYQKNFTGAKSSTAGSTFTAVTSSNSYTRTHVDQTVTITLYGYCDSGTSEDKSTVTTSVTIPAKPKYTVTLIDVEEAFIDKWYDEPITLPVPSKDNYTFLGWQDATGTTYTEYTGNADITLTAQWLLDKKKPEVTDVVVLRNVGDETQATITVAYVLGDAPNLSSVVLSYRDRTTYDTLWQPLITITDVPQSLVSYTSVSGKFLTDHAYDIRISISDAYYTDLVYTAVLPKTNYILKITDEHLDLGKPVNAPLLQQDGKNVATQEYVSTLFKDFVIEQGTRDGWDYRIWNSGTKECWKNILYNNGSGTTITGVVQKVAGVYTTNTLAGTTVAFPTNFFTKRPTGFVSAQTNGYHSCQVNNVTTSALGYRIWSSYSSGNYTLYQISFYAIGK